MAINRVDYPANLTDQDDFSAHGDLIETRFIDQVNAPQWVVSGNIPQGVVLQIGGVVYRADSDTAITGTASDYVQVTPSGATASAAYVANLTGVSWSAQYSGYYDASENLYLFDEGKALKDSPAITALLTRYVTRTEDGDTYIGRDLDVERNLTARGTAGITGNTTVGGTLGVTGSATFGSIAGPMRATNILHTTNPTEGAIFTALSAAIPTTGDIVIVSGAASRDSPTGGRHYLDVWTHAERTSDTSITLRGSGILVRDPTETALAAATSATYTVTSGDTITSLYDYLSLAW